MTNSTRAKFVLLFSGLLWMNSIRADDWPEFRGPTGQGLAAGRYETEWGTEKNVVWKQTIPGRGWSSPIVWRGKVFLTTAEPLETDSKSQSLRALAIESATGRIIWDHEVFRLDGQTAPQIHSKNGHASPTPTTDGERLFVHFGHQGTACLSLDGNLLWQRRDLLYEPRYGAAGSPILADGKLTFSCDGQDVQFVIALDTRTGETIWKTDRQIELEEKYAFSTPLLIDVQGQPQLVSPAAGAIMAYNPGSGQEIWRVKGPESGFSNVLRPLYGHGLVFASDSGDDPELLAIRPDGTGDITKTHVVWRDNKTVGLTVSPLLVGDELFSVSDSGIASCLDARTGRVHWRKRLGGDHSASPIHADGMIYFQSEKGVGTVIKASRTFELVAKNDLKEITMASYAAVDQALFIRTETQLYRIGSRP